MSTDPKWSACLFQLCAAWNRLGPDKTLAALKVLAASDVTDEGLLVLEIAARGGAALWPGRSLARVLAGVVLRPTLPRQLKGPDLLA
jgi:hypothetical protein